MVNNYDYDVLMKVVNVKKKFGHVEALRGVNLDIGKNEVVGLLGDNGAGKSTLIKMITGVYEPDDGDLYWKDRKLKNYSVSKARDLGIETVFQDRALSEQHTLWKNVFMGRELTNWWGQIDIKKEKEDTKELMKERMGFTSSAITSDAIIANLSGGEKQGVAISRALYFDADLIILDEPTTGLSLSETQKVLGFVEEIKKAGKSCIFITHNLYHVYPVADRVIIIDRGMIIGSFDISQFSVEELSHKMRTIARTGKIENSSSSENFSENIIGTGI